MDQGFVVPFNETFSYFIFSHNHFMLSWIYLYKATVWTNDFYKYSNGKKRQSQLIESQTENQFYQQQNLIWKKINKNKKHGLYLLLWKLDGVLKVGIKK